MQQFKCNNIDFVQVIFYVDSDLNKSKVESKCGIEEPALPT